jgi:hypothetical protein
MFLALGAWVSASALAVRRSGCISHDWETVSESSRRWLFWIGVVVAGVLFAGLTLCEGYLAQRPPHYLRLLVWLVPTLVVWGMLLTTALLLSLARVPRPRLVRPLVIAAAVLSPLLAWPLTRLTTPLADYFDQRSRAWESATSAATTRRKVAELTALFAYPQRVTALNGHALLLESGVSVELSLAQPGTNGVFESYLQREIVGHTVQICLPDDFADRYSDILTNVDPWATRLPRYGTVPALVFAQGELVNLHFAWDDRSRVILERLERACQAHGVPGPTVTGP